MKVGMWLESQEEGIRNEFGLTWILFRISLTTGENKVPKDSEKDIKYSDTMEDEEFKIVAEITLHIFSKSNSVDH